MDTRIPPGKNKTIVYAGFVRCGHCGENMIRRQISHGNRKYYYYVCCSKRKKPHKYANYRIAETVLEQEIFSQIQNHINEVLHIRDVITEIDIGALQTAHREKITKAIDIMNAHLSTCQSRLQGLNNESTSELLTEAERAELRNYYTQKYLRIEKCIDSVRARVNTAAQASYFSSWIDLYTSFAPFEILTRPLLALLVHKIIVDESKGVHVIFLHGDKMRLLRPYVQRV